MKAKFSKSFFLVALLFTITVSAYAQIYVKIRPTFSGIVRIPQPNPTYVWVDEEWEPDDATYRYSGGRWEAPPRDGYLRKSGYWKKSPSGLVWVKGQWYQQPKNNDEHKGQYKQEDKYKDKD